jgi:hypothetical protein
MIMLGLGLTPYVSFPSACLALIAYLLLCVLVFLRTSSLGEFKISYSKLGPTEIRVLLIFLNVSMYFGGERMSVLRIGVLDPITFSPYDIVVAIIGLLLLYFFVVTAVRDIVRLARENK